MSLLWGCGRKGPPLPPLREVPETTTDLTVFQEEQEVVLRWSFPTLTRSGQPLRDVQVVEVWRSEVPPGQERNLEGPQGVELKRQLILSRGRLVARLTGATLEAATQGGALEYREPAPVSPGQTAPLVLYAVRSRASKGPASEFSNVVGWQAVAPPSPPGQLVAQALAEGIALRWQGLEGASFRVERREGGGPWTVVAEDLPTPTFTDTTARQGQSYAFRVRTKWQRASSQPSAEVQVDYADVYPPPVPTNLVCLPETGRVTLRWDPSSESGVRFKVFRRSAAGVWEHLHRDWSETTFLDPNPPRGELTYAVKAFDPAGNESEAATCTARGGP
ncbi:MAG: fibronectin type III domain-containing protein [Thermoanaerobaculum sp.]|nr:fibronectin type III domain-containing protein [Thermoanaerobaculum sp.]